jgi:hypothetical protein
LDGRLEHGLDVLAHGGLYVPEHTGKRTLN